MTSQLSGGIYRRTSPTSKCAERVEIAIKSPYRHGEADVEVKALDTGTITRLQQWPGQSSARNAEGSSLSPERERDGWVTFSNGKNACVYAPE